jgi:hypothetical protein
MTYCIDCGKNDCPMRHWYMPMAAVIGAVLGAMLMALVLI